MHVTFITGDRTATPWYPALVAVEMLRAQAAGVIVTGGVERGEGVNALVQDFATKAGIVVHVLEREEDEEWNAYHGRVMRVWNPTSIVAIHSDPHASSVTRSLLALTEDEPDRLRLVTPADLYA